VSLPVINLKPDMPTVEQALQRLERELALARQRGHRWLKLIHGYGSKGVGGDIRLAAQRRLREMSERGQVQGCIFGEDWSVTDEQSWALLQTNPSLRQDPDLGKKNRGITIVLL